jgi:hypothetical protein
MSNLAFQRCLTQLHAGVFTSLMGISKMRSTKGAMNKFLNPPLPCIATVLYHFQKGSLSACLIYGNPQSISEQMVM